MGCRESRSGETVSTGTVTRDTFTYKSIDGDRNSQDEVKDEEPSPSRHPALAVHAGEKSSLEIARKHLSDNTAHDEKTTATG